MNNINYGKMALAIAGGTLIAAGVKAGIGLLAAKITAKRFEKKLAATFDATE